MFDVDDPQIENASKPRNLACASCNIAFRDKYIGAVSTGTSVKF